MTYGEVIQMKNNLDKVNFIEGADAKFVYAVAKNKAKTESIIKVLDGMIKPSDEIIEYREALDKLNQEFAEKDPDGTVGYITIPSYGRGYRKIVGDGNPDSAFMKKVIKLKLKYAKDISEHEAKIKTYTSHLDNELPEGEFRMLMIDLDIVPKGLHPAAMSGCLAFIKDTDIK